MMHRKVADVRLQQSTLGGAGRIDCIRFVVHMAGASDEGLDWAARHSPAATAYRRSLNSSTLDKALPYQKVP